MDFALCLSVNCPPGIQLRVMNNPDEVGLVECSYIGELLRWRVNGTTIAIPGGASFRTVWDNPSLPDVFAVLFSVVLESPGSSGFRGNRTSTLLYEPSFIGPESTEIMCGGILAVDRCSITLSIGT